MDYKIIFDVFDSWSEYPIKIDCEISLDEEMMFLFDEQIIFVFLKTNIGYYCLSFGKYKDVKEELEEYKNCLCVEESVICGQFKDGSIKYITNFIIKKIKI